MNPLPDPIEPAAPLPPAAPTRRDSGYVATVEKLSRYLDVPDEVKVVRWGYARTLAGTLVRVTMFAPHDVPETLAEVLQAEYGEHLCPTDNPLGIAYGVRSDGPTGHGILTPENAPTGLPERPRLPGADQVTRLTVRCGCGVEKSLRRAPWRSAVRKFHAIQALYAAMSPEILRTHLHAAKHLDLRHREKPADSASALFDALGPPALADLIVRGQLTLQREGDRYLLRVANLADLTAETCPVLDPLETGPNLGESALLQRYLLWSVSLRATSR